MSRYKLYVSCLLAPTVVAALAFASVLSIVWGRVTTPDWWIVNSYRAKSDIARHTPSPKILIVGGSGAYFGIQAEKISAAAGLPAVNFGVHGGLPIPYLAFRAKRVLHPGDIVMLVLEYPYFGSSKSVNSVTVSIVLATSPGYLLTLSPADLMLFFRQITFDRLSAGIGAITTPVEYPGGYDMKGLNQWGDETTAYPSSWSRDNFETNLNVWRKLGLPSHPNISQLDDLRDFVDWCRKRSITVIATWPNTVKAAPFDGPEFDQLHVDIRNIYADLGVRIIGRPEDAEMPRSLMLDTPYHLTLEGASIRSAALARALCTETTLCRNARSVEK
jgi:hypothetical protein